MNAAVISIKTPTFIKTIAAILHVLPGMYEDWVRAKAEEVTIRTLDTSGRTFLSFLRTLYATDVTFQQSNRPVGSMAGVIPFYSGKRRLYSVKMEVSHAAAKLLGVKPNKVWVVPHPWITQFRPVWIGKRRWAVLRKKLRCLVMGDRTAQAEQMNKTTEEKWKQSNPEIAEALR
ncbi:hypothetical protein PR003_g24273 [Phytophthora rubi]|uniref:Uncharacterized protein n=1 Tax=Phytophthora rubi TaxID=129364 RepID=A0A6A3M1C8_9STRA|nr:hypothetical protein PR002_g11531 [Phytophthora rubi]KAE9032564.1 hypothetical protein PR001_g10553 [Phytophthora rubi]KAE9294375.1 hypothetical protein PR003_g24273 [Phytophthora rubi]